MLRLSYVGELAFSTVVETEGPITSSKRRRKPTMKVADGDPSFKTGQKDPKASSKKPQKAGDELVDDEEGSGTIREAFLVNLMKFCLNFQPSRLRRGGKAQP